MRSTITFEDDVPFPNSLVRKRVLSLSFHFVKSVFGITLFKLSPNKGAKKG
jgi:hypothetical protein